MTSGLDFGILGALEMRWRGELCRVGRPKSRQVLATLLLHANQFVRTELIAEVLWGDQQPRSAATNLRGYVHELRDSCVAVSGSSPIRTHHGGYSIDVEPESLDAERFQARVTEVQRLRACGDHEGALHAAEEACRLWRGHPLDDLPIAPAWQVTLDRLERSRRELLDTLTELWMRCGNYQRARGLLRERIDEELYTESLWVRYITCLAATGHRAEARKAAREIRRVLADELGTEPGAELRQLEELVDGGGEVSADPAASVATATAAPRQTPCQLPLDVADFTGRARELEYLRDFLTDESRTRPLVTVLSGPPGVGKTTLAVHLGHLLRDRYPDGQLFLDMRATSHPRDVAGAIGELLYSLGAATPGDLDRRAAALRSALAGRRVLVLLDDAATAQQVAPLLPGTGGSAVLVTSRQRLSDLAGVTRYPVGELDDADSATLLTGVTAAGRAPLRPAEARAVLRACGRLPLAIRIAGSRLVQRGDLSASGLAERLQDERRRLDELRVGDLAVRASADLSYRMLDDAETRLYHVLGLMGVGELPAWLLNESGIGHDPERTVDALVEANLVQVVGTDTAGYPRYRMHDLLRCHAFERATAVAPEQARGDLVAVLSLFLARSTRLAGQLPYRFLGVTTDESPAELRQVADVPSAEWFDAHRQIVTPLVRAAATHGAEALAWQLAASWAPYFDLCASFEDWASTHTTALECARRAASGFGEATLLRNLGQLAIYRDDYRQAEDSLGRAYRLFGSLPHQAGAGVAAVGLGTCRRIADDHAAALHWYEVSLEHFLAAGDRDGEAVARNAIGGIWLRLRQPETAATWLRAALDLCRETGDRHREALVRRRIARLREQQGDLDAAVGELGEALDLLTAIGDERCAATVLRSLGPRLADRGDLTTARGMLVTALDVGHRLADARGEAEAASHLAQLHEAMGEPDSARKYLHRAHRAWQQVGEAAPPQREPVPT